MNTVERLHAVLNFEKPDRLPVLEWAAWWDKTLERWYEEGLVDAEVFTRGSSSREYLLSEDLGGSTHDWFASTAGYNDKLQSKIDGFTFKAFAPPASPRLSSVIS